jgi:hypothetical protein
MIMMVRPCPHALAVVVVYVAGAVSELAPFGAGITNYFKFEKWCAWVFLFMFLIYVSQPRPYLDKGRSTS